MATVVNKTSPSIMLCPKELRAAINNDPVITPTCENVTVDNEVDLTLYFSTALTSAEDSALDSLIAGFACPPGSGGTPPSAGQLDEDAGIVILNDGQPLIADVASINFEGSVAAVDDSNSRATVLIGSIEVKNTTALSISKGTPVYITGVDTTTNEVHIAPADASDPAKMPALGIVVGDIAPSLSGLVTIMGEVRNLDTSTYAIGDNLYVAPGGGVTNTKPTGANNSIQKIAQVTKIDPTEGRVVVFGAGRSNDVPNIGENNVWIGDANGVATPSPLDLALLSDTNISTPASNGDVLAYDSATGKWINRSPTSLNGGSTTTVVAPSTTELIDSVDVNSIRAVKWFVTIFDNVSNNTISLEVFASHRNGSNAVHNISSVIGDTDNINYHVSVSIAGTTLDLSITNNEVTNTLTISATKIPVYA